MRLFYGLQRQYIVVQHKRNYKKKIDENEKLYQSFTIKFEEGSIKKYVTHVWSDFFFDLNKSSCCKKVGYQVKMLITNEFYSSKSI